MLIIPTRSFCADHYIDPAGSDAGTCTSVSPCLTISYAYTQMSGGDTLFINDGTYSGSNNLTTYNSELPPSGSSGSPTIVRATNIPCQGGVACNQPLKAIFDSDAGIVMQSNSSTAYVKYQGIFFARTFLRPDNSSPKNFSSKADNSSPDNSSPG